MIKNKIFNKLRSKLKKKIMMNNNRLKIKSKRNSRMLKLKIKNKKQIIKKGLKGKSNIIKFSMNTTRNRFSNNPYSSREASKSPGLQTSLDSKRMTASPRRFRRSQDIVKDVLDSKIGSKQQLGSASP